MLITATAAARGAEKKPERFQIPLQSGRPRAAMVGALAEPAGCTQSVPLIAPAKRDEAFGTSATIARFGGVSMLISSVDRSS